MNILSYIEHFLSLCSSIYIKYEEHMNYDLFDRGYFIGAIMKTYVVT